MTKQRKLEYAKATALYNLVAEEVEILGLDLNFYSENTLEKFITFLDKHTLQGVRNKIQYLTNIEQQLSAQL